MEWKAEYAFIFFCVFIGAGFQFTQDKNEDNQTIIQRLYSQFAAVVFGGLLLIGILLIWLELNLWFPVILGIPVGIVGEKFLRLWMQYGNQATGLKDFVRRMKSAYKMVEQNDSTKNQEKET